MFFRMAHSMRENADGKVELLGYVDSDDPALDAYQSIAYGFEDCPGMFGERLPLGPAYQKLVDICKGDIVMMCADDIVFKTKGWDTRVKETMPKDLIGVVSCNELPIGHREHGHPFIGRRFIEEMGYICHPSLRHSCVDMWVREVAESIGRFYYLDDVITEHVHPKYGKGQLDDTYKANTKDIKRLDGDFYFGPGSVERKKAIERLSECLNGSSGLIKTNP